MKIKRIWLRLVFVMACGWLAAGFSVLAEKVTVLAEKTIDDVWVFSIQEPIGTDMYYEKESNVYWFGDSKVSIPVEEWNNNEGNLVICSTDVEFENFEEVIFEEQKGSIDVELPQSGEIVTWYFKGINMSGEELPVQSIQLGWDSTPPELISVNFVQLNDDEWLNSKELQDESKVAFLMEAKDDESGIRGIEYSFDGGKSYQEAECIWQNGVYECRTKESMTDGITYDWSIRIWNQINRSSEQQIVNAGKIDARPPEKDAYIKFISDVAGENDKKLGTVTNNQWSSKTGSMENEKWSRIWAKKELKFEVYVKDETSGVEAIAMSCNGKEIAKEHLKRISEEKEGFKGYTIFEGTIKNDDDQEMTIRNFQIESITDFAGNVMKEKVLLNGSKDTDLIVLDDRSPVLKMYEQNASTACYFGDIPVYQNVSEKGDVIIKFTIEDAKVSYIPKNLFVNVYAVGKETPVYSLKGSDFCEVQNFLKQDSPMFIKDGDQLCYQFAFDGEAGCSGEYYTTISYVDGAGNYLTGSSLQECKEGLWKSDGFIVDHKAPEFTVFYITDAVNIITEEGENAKILSKKPSAGHLAYYQQSIEVLLTLEEEYRHCGFDRELEHFEMILKKDGELIETPKLEWEHSEENSSARFVIPKADGNYQFEIRYQDCAGNPMVSEVKEVQEGRYVSPVLIIDTTPPKLTAEYIGTAYKTFQDKDYFQTPVILKITVEDRNIRYKELKSQLAKFCVTNVNGEELKTSFEEQLNAYPDTKMWCANGLSEPAVLCLNVKLLEDGQYQIPIYFTDLGGNPAIVNKKNTGYTEEAVVDTTIPKLALSYSVEDPANYKEHGYLFARKNLKITAAASDRISGIQKIRFIITDEQGKKIIKTKTCEPEELAEYCLDIPLETEDFKGSIRAEVTDYAQNSDSKIRNHIVESTARHSKTGKAEIKMLTSPGRTVNGIDFYNTDVEFQILLQDTYSGIGSWEYLAGKTIHDSKDYKKEAGTGFDEKPKQEIVYRLEQTLKLDAKQNNENKTLLKASFLDNAGHSLEVEKEIHIDVTRPVVSVTYDLNEPVNGKYYHEVRTATVKIKERNFQAEDVQFLYTSTDGKKPEFGSWTKSGTGDETIHTCTVTFREDSDYTFAVKFMDMAGNIAEYHRIDEFTIDRTKPVVTVDYDNDRFQNEYYYKESRTAVITVLEHNFSAESADILVTRDGREEVCRLVWTSNGDEHTGKILFDDDGAYTFDIAGRDLAGNELDDYPEDYFVIDQTAPELEILNLHHQSANNGVVRPKIRCFDQNYEKGSEEIILEGYHHGQIKIKGEQTWQDDGFLFHAEDFSYDPEIDDLYTLKAAAFDLAGNRKEIKIRFSVNRFGSVYTFDQKTEALVGKQGKYFTNTAPEIVVTETNADTLEFREILWNLNGNLKTLKEGEDYTVICRGDESSWKQYTYTFEQSNFEEEGRYILTIYSEDHAKNSSDNSSKGKRIEFVVDKTSPAILISGVVNEGQYRTDSQEVTIYLEDNVAMKKAVISVGGKDTVYDAGMIEKERGKLTVNVGRDHRWQELSVSATDAAGNTAVSEKIRVLVTANILIQFYRNKPLLYGSIVLAAAAGGSCWILFEKKKKDRSKEISS